MDFHEILYWAWTTISTLHEDLLAFLSLEVTR
jgi:hypothetical protein